MTDPPQLKVVSRNGFSRVLLESAGDDRAAPGAAGRALNALSAGAAATAAGAAAKAGASSSVSSKWAGLLAMKWLGLGVLAGVTTLASVNYAVRRSSRASLVPTPSTQPATTVKQATTLMTAATAATTATTATPDPQAPTLASPISPETTRPAEVPTARVASVALPSSGSAEPPIDAAADDLSALRKIRAALIAHAPARALTLLDAFERDRGGSSLAEEATVLRIEALADLGRSDAQALGEDFLRQYPHSAYAQRVRSKLHLP